MPTSPLLFLLAILSAIVAAFSLMALKSKWPLKAGRAGVGGGAAAAELEKLALEGERQSAGCPTERKRANLPFNRCCRVACLRKLLATCMVTTES